MYNHEERGYTPHGQSLWTGRFGSIIFDTPTLQVALFISISKQLEGRYRSGWFYPILHPCKPLNTCFKWKHVSKAKRLRRTSRDTQPANRFGTLGFFLPLMTWPLCTATFSWSHQSISQLHQKSMLVGPAPLGILRVNGGLSTATRSYPNEPNWDMLDG